MKVVKAFKTTGTVGYNSLPLDVQDKLIGKTLNQAIAEGLIEDIGDNDGNFVLHNEQNEDWKYTLINGCRVTLSTTLAGKDFTTEVLPNLGNLTFGGDISTVKGEGEGKYWFNLGMPRTSVLVAEASSITAATEMAEA